MGAGAERSARVRRGIWMFPGLPAASLVDAIVAAEELGLDEVWVADEGVARDPMAVLAAAAPATTRIRLAIGVTSPILRHPGVIASAIATVDELSDGRAVLGLGVGGELSLTPFGIDADRPVGRLRDAVRLVRAVHEGVATEGYEPPDHAMPGRAVPLWMGARGPQLVRLAAGVADGLFLSGCTAAQHEAIVAEAHGVADIATAIYQTAVDRPSSASELDWDAAQVELGRAAAHPATMSVGLNLVQFATAGTDPTPLVERAAELLSSL